MIYKLHIKLLVIVLTVALTHIGKCHDLEAVENFVYKPKFQICHTFIDLIKNIGFDAFEYDDTEIMNQANKMRYSEMHEKACTVYKEYTELRRKWLTGTGNHNEFNEWRKRNLLSIECWIRMGTFSLPCQAKTDMEALIPLYERLTPVHLSLTDYHFLYFEWILFNAQRVNGKERDPFTIKEQSYIISPPYFCAIRDVVINDKCIYIYMDSFYSFTYTRLSDHTVLFFLALNFSCSPNLYVKKSSLCGIRWKDGTKIEIKARIN